MKIHKQKKKKIVKLNIFGNSIWFRTILTHYLLNLNKSLNQVKCKIQ